MTEKKSLNTNPANNFSVTKTVSLKFFIVTIFLLAFVFSNTNDVFAATSIYRSVAPSATSALDTGSADSNSLTISGSTATFSIAVPDNVGVGDAIQYDSNNDGSIDSIAFIHGRTSSTVYTVKDSSGAAPTSTSAGDEDWSIYRAYTSFRNAFQGTENTGIDDTVENFDSTLSNYDFVTADEQWNFAMYGNSGTADTGGDPAVSATTGSDTFVRIFSPVSSSEVGVSQRSTGVFDSDNYYFFNGSYGMRLYMDNVYIEGIQLNRAGLYPSGNGATVDYKFVSNIIDNKATGDTLSDSGLTFYTGNSSLSGSAKVFNNVFANSTNTFGFIYNRDDIPNYYIYNNTFYDVSTPFFYYSSGTILKNNIFYGVTTFPGGTVSAQSDYNSTDSASFGSGYTTNSNDRVNQTFNFLDTGNYNYNLKPVDTGALDLGADLSAETELVVDQTGVISRPQNSVWDIGALEYVPGPDTAPPGLSGMSPADSSELPIGTTSTTLSINTNEDSTCKYDTTADTAFDSMANTFSNTGGTTHTTTLSGLSDGRSYNYFIRCEDGSGNENTSDYDLTFSVEDDGIVYANSCSVSDVNIAMGYAEAGDTLQIPAGTCTGYASYAGLAINKAITVQGAGPGQTILQLADDTGSWNSAAFPITAAATVKDMTIQTGTVKNGTAFAVNSPGFRITNIEYINNNLGANAGYFVVDPSGGALGGLIDNNDITGAAGNNELIFIRGPVDAWQSDNTLGTKDNIFIEDNIFRGAGYVSDCNSNSRCVVRNNTVYGDMKVDGHGLASNSPARGVRNMEVYENDWVGALPTWTILELRGGTGIVFNNTTDSTGARFYLTDYGYTAYWPNFGRIQCLEDYPIKDQIGVGKDPKVAASEPMYLWNNTASGSQLSIAWKAVPDIGTSGCSTTFTMPDVIQADIDYYMNDDSFDGTSGVGRGTLANRPATCTTGVGYWATDQGTSWDSSNGTGADGTLYKCTSTNTWTESYTPYAYPHYLTAESTTGTDEVDIGAGARMFGNGVFYGFDTGSTSGSTADLSVTPGNTADSWVDIEITTWETSGTYNKVWTESMPSINSTSTVHVVGDLNSGEDYNVIVDGVLGDGITGASCTSGVCTANGSGQIEFTYPGGYSEVQFEVEQAGPDTTAPTITNVSSDKANGTYGIGEVIDIDVTFSELVTSTGNVTVTLETGTTDRTCTFTVSNSTTGTCDYTVQAGDTSADLEVSSITGTIADQSSNAMINFTPSTNLAANKDLVIDTTPDATAPTLAEVIAVSTPTTDTTPSYTFSTNEAGTISYGGSCSSATTVATAGSNTISFNTLSDGTYSDCTITVTDASSNSSTPLSVTTFVIDTVTPDTTAPTLAEVTPVSTPTSDTTPSYTFSTNEDGDITYGGSCSSGTTSATAGNNTITFNTLSAGTYSDCTITVTDASSNASTPLSVTSFTVSTSKEGGGGGGGGGGSSSSSDLDLTCSVSNTEVAPNSDIQISLTIEDGEAPFEYEWSRDAEDVEGFDLTKGSQIIKIEDEDEYQFKIEVTDDNNDRESVYCPIIKVNDRYDLVLIDGEGVGDVIIENTDNTNPSTLTTYQFTRDLTLGVSGEDVRQLQIFLNSNGYTIAFSGPGSTGNETTYFGELTRQALVKYQMANNISPAVGYFGPLTRGSIKESSNFSPTPVNTSVPSTSTGQTLSMEESIQVLKVLYYAGEFNENDSAIISLLLKQIDPTFQDSSVQNSTSPNTITPMITPINTTSNIAPRRSFAEELNSKRTIYEVIESLNEFKALGVINDFEFLRVSNAFSLKANGLISEAEFLQVLDTINIQ